MSRTAKDILLDAAEAFAEHDRISAELRASNERIQKLCREYSETTRRWGYAPHHLRFAVEAQIGKIAA